MRKNKILSFLFVALRLTLVATFFVPFTLPRAVFGVSELSALAFTVAGLLVGQVAPNRTSLMLPFLYCVPLLFRNGPHNMHAAGFLAAFCGFQIALRVMMLERISIGVPVFVRLLDSGPWALIRHPLYLVEFLQGVSYAATIPTTWNMVVCCLLLPSIVGSALIEEKFLLTIPAYATYAKRVRWRFLPGVW